MQAQFPAQPALARIEFGQLRRRRLDHEGAAHVEPPKLLQLAEQAQRVVAGLQQVRQGHEADRPAVHARCRGGRRGRHGGRFAADQAHQFAAQRLAVGVGRGQAVAGVIEHRAQAIHRAQQQIDQFAVHAATLAAHFLQQRFGHVGERSHLGKAERGRAALDRVRGAEDGVHQLMVGRARIQREQRRLHRVQPFQALLEKGLVELGQVDGAHRYSFSRARA